ncbi:MAG TPA: hemolysin family protein [Blastocatellia bacterium]|nr:hemolysin family protein [Blastocatellia bacterium]
MDSGQIVWIVSKLLFVALLIFANGFFVASEFALVTVRRPRIEALAEKGSRTAQAVQRLQSDPTTFISATQLGITLASLALGWIGEATLADEVFIPLFDRIWPERAVVSAHALAIPIAFISITYMHILFGELVPKAMSLERTEVAALMLARPLELFIRVFKPFIWLLEASGSAVLKLLGFGTTLEHASVYNEEEIRQIVQISQQRGHLKPDEQILINNVFEFTDTVAREVMIPRPEVVAIEISTPLADIVKEFQVSGYSRLPVYRGQFDEVAGVLHSKDLMPFLLKPEGFRIERIMHQPLFVPDNGPLEEVLRHMQRKQSHFAIVVDEHGGVEGILTLEDLLEEIVGEIQDEHDEDIDDAIHSEVDGTCVIAGSVSMRELNKRLDLELPEADEYTTLAGFLLARAGRLLSPGDQVEYEGLSFTVELVDRRRIARVRMERLAEAASQDD